MRCARARSLGAAMIRRVCLVLCTTPKGDHDAHLLELRLGVAASVELRHETVHPRVVFREDVDELED